MRFSNPTGVRPGEQSSADADVSTCGAGSPRVLWSYAADGPRGCQPKLTERIEIEPFWMPSYSKRIASFSSDAPRT